MIHCEGANTIIDGPPEVRDPELIRVMIGFIVMKAGSEGLKAEEIEKFFMQCVVDAFNNLDKINEKK